MDGGRITAVGSVPEEPGDEIVRVDGDIFGREFMATMIDRWLMNFGDKRDHLAMGYYRAGLDLR